jgi:Tfp pilus assembly protein PilO
VQVKTKNILFAVVVVLLVGVLWYRVVYSPMEAKASKDKTAAHDADLSAATLRQAVSGTGGASKAKKNSNVPTDLMLAAVPVDASEASFLRSIDELRVSSGADWQSITPTLPVVAGPVASITVGITVQGTESQLASYESGLESLKRIFVIDNLAITGTPSSSSATAAAANGHFTPGPLSLQVSGRIFAQPGAVADVGGATGTSTGTATTPATVAPTSGATAPSGVQNN